MPIHTKLAIPALALALLGSGCVAHGYASSSFEAQAEATEPELVSISPDVWVVEDHDEAVFFHADAYWTFRGGAWHRSDVYTGGWVRVTAVPTVIVQIDQPDIYIHYHGPDHAKRRGHDHYADTKTPAQEDKQETRSEPKERDEARDRQVKNERHDKEHGDKHHDKCERKDHDQDRHAHNHEHKAHDGKGRGKKGHGDKYEKRERDEQAYRGKGKKHHEYGSKGKKHSSKKGKGDASQ